MDPDNIISHLLAPVSSFKSANKPPEPTTPATFTLSAIFKNLLSAVVPSDYVRAKIYRGLWILQAYYRFLFVTNYDLLQVSLLEPARALFNPVSTLLALLFFFSVQVVGLTITLSFGFLRITGLYSILDGLREKYGGGWSFANLADPGVFTRYEVNIEKAKRIFSAGYDCPESVLEKEPADAEEHVENALGTRTRFFNLDVAKTLLVFSTALYERNDELVYETVVDPKADPQKHVEAESRIEELAKSWGLEFSGVSDLNSYGGAFAGLWWDPNSNWIVISFKGTTPFCGAEWLEDLTLTKTNAKAFLFGQAHQGFYDKLFPDYSTHIAYSPYGNILQTIRELAKELKKQSGSKNINLYVTGHSLGSAIATSFYARAIKSPSDFGPNIKICNAYVFGTPRVGDIDYCAGFYSALNQPFGNTQILYRVINDTDIVARVPVAAGDDHEARDSVFNYGHVGEAIVINGNSQPIFTGNRFAPGATIRVVQDDSQYGYDHEARNGSSSVGGQNQQNQNQKQNQKPTFTPPSILNPSSLAPDNVVNWAHSLTLVQLAHWVLPIFIQDHFPARYFANLDRLRPENVTHA